MAYVKCRNGHWYDPTANSSCPQCAANAVMGFAGYGATEPFHTGAFGGNASATEPVNSGGGSGYGGVFPTEPLSPNFSGMSNRGGASDVGKTVPANEGAFSATPPTEPLYSSDGPSASDGGFAPMPVTVPLGADSRSFNGQQSVSFRPVVGWLVCVEGADRGRDYQIRDGYNTIGREPGNDIAIQNDRYISREKHAMIAYDRREKLFFFGPAEGRNIVRLNGKLLMQAAALHPYDIIDFESTKLIFVPFCGERFNWDE